MVVIDVAGRVERVEVLSFDEPPDYLPGAAWYRQFLGQALDSQLALKRDIDGITGATLTARATTEAVRRVLAVHGVLMAAQDASR
jgi:Na+-translocating ferredoxin:NAD+ oxidoreductase RnfG subunit